MFFMYFRLQILFAVVYYRYKEREVIDTGRTVYALEKFIPFAVLHRLVVRWSADYYDDTPEAREILRLLLDIERNNPNGLWVTVTRSDYYDSPEFIRLARDAFADDKRANYQLVEIHYIDKEEGR